MKDLGYFSMQIDRAYQACLIFKNEALEKILYSR